MKRRRRKADEWWTPEELASKYKLSASYIRKLIAAKKIGATSRPYRIPDEERLKWERAWLGSVRKQPEPEPAKDIPAYRELIATYLE